MTLLKASAAESRILGYQVWRGNPETLADERLFAEIVDSSADLVKLTVDSSDPLLYQRLDNMGFPYYVVGMINNYRYNCQQHKHKEYHHPDIVFEEYAGLNSELLADLAREIFRETPGSFYSNPYLKNITPPEKQLECFVEYVLGFDPAKDPKKLTFLVKHQGEYVGFISLSIDGDNSEAAYAGVIPGKRGTGYYLDMIRFVHNWGAASGVKSGFVNVQVQNIPVQKFYARENTIIFKNYVSIHLNTFFSRSVFPARDIPLRVDEKELSSNQLVKKIQGVFLDTIPSIYSMRLVKGRQVRPIEPGNHLIKTSYPLADDESILVHTRVMNARNELILFYYFEFRK